MYNKVSAIRAKSWAWYPINASPTVRNVFESWESVFFFIIYYFLYVFLHFFVMCWQERLAKAHGSQCGFCTPGMVMSVYTLLRNKPEPSMDDITQALAGVLDQFFLQSHSITSYFSCWSNGTSKKQNRNLHVLLLIPWLNRYICSYLRRCVCVFCRQPVSLHWVSTHRGRLQDLLPGTKSTSVTKTRYVSYSLITLIFSGRASALTALAVYKPSNWQTH